MRSQNAVRSLVTVLGATAWLAAGALLAQQDLTGRAIISYQLFGSDQLDSSGLHQIYDLRFQRAIAEPLRLRLSFRGEGNNGSTDLGLFTTKTTFWQLQPSAEIMYLLPNAQLRGTYDLYDTRSSSNDLEDRRKLQRVTAALSWAPEDLPALTAQTDQRRQKDALARIDQTDGSVLEALTLTRPTFTLGQSALYQTLDLNSIGFSRKTYGIQGQGQYQETLFNGRLSASGNVQVGFTRIDDNAGGAASVPTQVGIPGASVSHDETPADSRDVPPLFAPALTDGNFASSAGISIGPDGMSFQNIFLDLQRFVGLDEFRVFVRDSAGTLVKIGGLVEWTVYTSNNNLDWTPVPGTAATGFVTTLSAYDVTFPKTTARYFKLVSFGTNSVETLVTEVQAFFHTNFAAGESARTDLRNVSATVQVSGRLTNWLTASYYGLLNDYHASPRGKAEYGSLDHDQIVTLEGKSGEKLDLQLRYEYRHAETGSGFTQSLSGYWATARYAFTPRWNTTLEASHTSDKNEQDIITDTLRLHQYARVYNALDVYVDGGVARQTYAVLQTRALQTFVTAYSYAQLTRSLRLGLSANLQRTKYEGAGAAGQFGVLESRDQRYYGELYYRPSSRLLLSGRFGYVGGTTVSGATETYRVEWYPFAGGAIGIGTIYDDDIETNGITHRFRRVQILPHWAINRHAILDLNYSFLTLKSTLPGRTSQTSTRQFYVTLTLTL